MKKILFTGANSRFCKLLKDKYSSKDILYTSKKQFNILNLNMMEKKSFKTILQ